MTISPWATSTLTCVPPPFAFFAPCRGDLHVTAVTSPQCVDVDVIVENITVEVYESGFVSDPTRRIALDGLVRGGQSPDCNSGGVGGCP